MRERRRKSSEGRSLEELISILRKHLPELQKRYGVKSLGVFGSYVRGEQRRQSDLDVLVELREDSDISLLDFIELEYYLSDLLGVKVDLVEKAGLKPYIAQQVLKEVVMV